jgi:hypothetical protein
MFKWIYAGERAMAFSAIIMFGFLEGMVCWVCGKPLMDQIRFMNQYTPPPTWDGYEHKQVTRFQDGRIE